MPLEGNVVLLFHLFKEKADAENEMATSSKDHKSYCCKVRFAGRIMMED